ncbi:hypothetical protein GW626_14700 [Peribacillus muralis]|uniref:hypothetical protein n=1 Tax=Peribacillus muralis TaxID=264697 RepID=UPI001F4E3494|nr:hypothetical protein [Peribacillus muralis]MCK1991593.1 hypothetical protein [Peribacillus muralis]MCK2012152.1 hypothetical protein [Peribacillus muralis]
MKFFIQLSAIILLLWTVPAQFHQHAQQLTLEEHTDVHHWEKADKKVPFIPALSSIQALIIILVFEVSLLGFLHYHSNLRRRYLSPVFFQANYVAAHSDILSKKIKSRSDSYVVSFYYDRGIFFNRLTSVPIPGSRDVSCIC